MMDSTEGKNLLIEQESNEVISELDEEAQLKLKVIQTLLEPCDRATYGKKLREAAEKLGKSKRTVQRLVKKWEEEGLAGLIQNKRADRGSHRIDWESGLIATPEVLTVRDLDICLMKQARRRIQRGGYLQFENLMYRGEYLARYAGETVVLRYEPRDITEILVYRQEGNKEVFLARAFAQDLETESISLDEAKASSKKVREAGKTISNRSILNEIRDRDLFTPQDKKTRKQKQKEEQTGLLMQKKAIQAQTFDEMEEEEEIVPVDKEVPKVEVLDYEDLQDDYGF